MGRTKYPSQLKSPNCILIKALRDSKLYAWYHRYIWRPSKSSIQHIIVSYARSGKDFFFIQIGANDGFKNDPVYKLVRSFNWRGILLEPLPDVFEKRLKRTYKGHDDNIHLINAALSDECGHKKFYRVSFSNRDWATRLGTFDRETLLKHYHEGYFAKRAKQFGNTVPDNPEDCITSEKVATETFESLFNKYDVNTVDALFIDAEGFDHRVLELFDFQKYRPYLVLFEHEHMKDSNYAYWVDQLRTLGYQLFTDPGNTLAYRPLDKQA